ncbi:MAG: protein phosphatase 2C domain-containing protein [Rhodoferax sp.]
MKFSVVQLSRRGGRQRNEDRLGYIYSREAALFALADGMGGHPQGDRAAHIAVEHSLALFAQQAQPRLADVPAFLRTTLLTVHQKILLDGIRQRLPDHPRTTLVMAVVQDGLLHWVHCGDSRLYWLRQGSVLACTRDHSLAEQARHAGAAVTVNRNVLFTCLGSPSTPVYTLDGPGLLQPEDRIMLCSDGLWAQISESALTQGLTQAPLEQAVPDLMAQALRGGGPRGDNVSCLAMQWHGTDSVRAGVCPVPEPHAVDDSGVEAPTRAASLDDDLMQAQQSLAEIEAALARSAPARGAWARHGTHPPSGESPQ